MTRQMAVATARKALPTYGAPSAARPRSAELQWVELPERAATQPGRVRDTRAWVIPFSFQGRPIIELAIEDATGKVVRDQRFM